MRSMNAAAAQKEPVFIHSLWRSSSTWFFNRFRAAAGYFAYQEPLHEVVVAAASNVDYLQPMSAVARAQLRHPDMGEGHFHELQLTHAAWKDHVSGPSVYDRYFDPAPDQQLIRFYNALIHAAPARPVLQECRTSSRIAPIKSEMGGIHLALNRNPRDQWWSFKSAPYFEAALQLLLQADPRPPLLDRIAHKAGFTPCPHVTIEQRFDHFMRLPLTHEDSYRLFFAIWCLATDHARQHADLIIDVDAFGEVPDASAQTIKAMAELGLGDVDLSGFAGFQAPLLDSSRGMFERIEAGVLIDLAIDGMKPSAVDALRDTLTRKEMIRARVIAQNAPALLAAALGRREETLYSAQDRERASALRSLSERAQEQNAALHELDALRTSLETRVSDLSARADGAEQERQRLLEIQAEAEARLNDNAEQLSRLAQAEQQLRREQAEADAQIALLTQEVAQRTEALALLESERDTAQGQIRHLSTLLDSHTAELAARTAELEARTSELNATALQNAQSMAAAQAAQTQLNATHAQLHDVSNRHLAAEARAAGLAAEAAALTRALETAQAAFQRIEQEAAHLSAAFEVAAQKHDREARDAADRITALLTMLDQRAQEAATSADRIAALSALNAQLAERERALAITVRQSQLVHDQVRALRRNSLSRRIRRLLGLPAAPLDTILNSWSGADVPSDTHQPPALQHEVAAMSTAANPYLRADSLAELCSWHDIDFVRCAYVTLLGRQPDPEGEADYVNRLRNGAHKLAILSDLRRSGEGRQHDPGIAGLDRALRRYRRGQWPIIRLFSQQEGNSPVERRLRALSNDIAVIGAQQRNSHEAIEALRHDMSSLSLPPISVPVPVAPVAQSLQPPAPDTTNWPHYSAQSVNTLKTLIRGEGQSE